MSKKEEREKELRQALDALASAKKRLMEITDTPALGVRINSKLHSIVWEVEILENKINGME